MSDTDSKDILVHAFPKGEDEEIRLGIQKYKGRYYIDFRVWFQDGTTPDFKPTRKGVSISADRFPELRKGMEKLFEGLEKGTLIPAEAVHSE